MTICHLAELRVGIGRHLYDVKQEWLPLVGKVSSPFRSAVLQDGCQEITRYPDIINHPGHVWPNGCIDEGLHLSDVPAAISFANKQMVQLFFHLRFDWLGNLNKRCNGRSVSVSLDPKGFSKVSALRLNRPLSDAWMVQKAMSDKNCIHRELFFIVTAAINSFTDCMVYLWPLHYLWQARLGVAKRVGLLICFGLGIV
jgi:hypothetical protein